mgnify:CR=1 FL=1
MIQQIVHQLWVSSDTENFYEIMLPDAMSTQSQEQNHKHKTENCDERVLTMKSCVGNKICMNWKFNWFNNLSCKSITHHDVRAWVQICKVKNSVEPKWFIFWNGFPSFAIFPTCSPLLRHTALRLPVMYTEHYQVMGDGNIYDDLWFLRMQHFWHPSNWI